MALIRQIFVRVGTINFGQICLKNGKQKRLYENYISETATTISKSLSWFGWTFTMYGNFFGLRRKAKLYVNDFFK